MIKGRNATASKAQRPGPCLDFGFQYSLIRNIWSKKFGAEYWPCLAQIAVAPLKEGHSCSFRTNLVSFRTFRCPLFPKPVSCPGLFCCFLQQDCSNPKFKHDNRLLISHTILKFIYSKKATKFCEISTLLLSVLTVDKSKAEISQNFVAFSE